MNSLRRIIARRLSIPLYQLVRNVPVSGYIRVLGDGWGWSEKELEDYQTRKLKRLLIHASDSIPFYRDRFAGAGFDPRRFTVMSELERVPRLTREDLGDLKSSVPPVASGKRGIASGSSSGTSGLPVTFLKDRYSMGMGRAALYFMQMRGGWKPGDRTVLVWGNPRTARGRWRTPGSKLNAFMNNEIRIPACDLSSDTELESAYRIIQRVRPEFIMGYSNSLALLSRYALSRGAVPFCGRVFTTAETLLEPARRAIEAAFGPAMDIYGCSEINGIAFQCPECGLYHGVSPHVHLELEPMTGQGGASLLVTDLDNRVMPLIRYRTGDIASPCEEHRPCPTGTRWWSFSGLLGRLSQIVMFRGKYINPITYFGDSMGRLLSERLSGLITYRTAWTGNEFITYLQCEETPSSDSMSMLDSEMASRLAPLGVTHSFVCSREPFRRSVSGKESFFADLSGDT